MNIIAMAFISAGYVLFYWGADQIKHWNRTVTDTEAATLKILAGFPVEKEYETIHKIPFPYESPSGGTTPSGNTKPKSNGGSGLSPNYPGGPGGTIPTPGIPGGGYIPA